MNQNDKLKEILKKDFGIEIREFKVPDTFKNLKDWQDLHEEEVRKFISENGNIILMVATAIFDSFGKPISSVLLKDPQIPSIFLDKIESAFVAGYILARQKQEIEKKGD